LIQRTSSFFFTVRSHGRGVIPAIRKPKKSTSLKGGCIMNRYTLGVAFAALLLAGIFSGCGKGVDELKAREIARDEAMKAVGQMAGPEKFVFGAQWEKDFSYSQGTKVGNVIYVAGQLAHGTEMDAQGMPTKFFMGSFEEQYRATLDNIKKVLEHFGATMDDVVFLQNFVAPISRDKTNKAGDYNSVAPKILREYFPKGLQAMTFVDVVALYAQKQLVESNAIAVITSKPAEAPAAAAPAPAEEKK
jgi:enamine deaminase RidA (YjgF/YER057c/UK114 family)